MFCAGEQNNVQGQNYLQGRKYLHEELYIYTLALIQNQCVFHLLFLPWVLVSVELEPDPHHIKPNQTKSKSKF